MRLERSFFDASIARGRGLRPRISTEELNWWLDQSIANKFWRFVRRMIKSIQLVRR